MSEVEHCPKAKLLVGSWQCPCHGMKSVGKPWKPDRPLKIVLSPEQIEEIQRLSDDGWSRPELAKKFRCGLSQLRSILGTTKITNKREPLTAIEIAEIRALYSQRVSIKALCRKFHTSPDRIKKAIEGLPRILQIFTPEQEAHIRQAHEAGQSIQSLGIEFKVDRRTIYRVLGRGSVRNSRPAVTT